MPLTREQSDNQSGFTLIEVFMAILILSGGLLALAAAFAPGMAIVNSAHYHQIAKEVASDTVENVFTARDSLLLDWSRIRNASDGGIFLNGEQLVRTAGADGLVNTADDGAVETVTLPGGSVVSLARFTRQIEIVEVQGNNGGMLRQITVTISYPVGSQTRQYQLITFISAYA
jgi:prepilin-type N-terminal cleavage/methylation domain-containing protein